MCFSVGFTASSRQPTDDHTLFVDEVKMRPLHHLDMVVLRQRSPNPDTPLSPQRRDLLNFSVNLDLIASNRFSTVRKMFPNPNNCLTAANSVIKWHHLDDVTPHRFIRKDNGNELNSCDC